MRLADGVTVVSMTRTDEEQEEQSAEETTEGLDGTAVENTETATEVAETVTETQE